MDRRIKETIVGIFIIGGIVLFIFFYIWLSGRLGLRASYTVKVYFNDVAGLRVGDPVMIYGLVKGKVRLLQIENNRVLVSLALDRDVVLPVDSRFAIRSVTYLGSDRYVKITPGMKDSLAEFYYGVNETLDLESIATQFDSLISTFENLELPDLSKIGIELSKVIDKSIARLSGVFSEPTDKLNTLVQRLDTLSLLIKGEGTVGKLLKSTELYEEVRQTNNAMRALIEDIKANPKKYLEIKVF